MEGYEHWSIIERPDTVELFIGEVRCARGQRSVCILIGRDDKVDGKAAGVGRVRGFEHMALVVDGEVLGFYRRPYGLQVAVEEERVEVTWGRCGLADFEEVGVGAVLGAELQGFGVVVEGRFGVP